MGVSIRWQHCMSERIPVNCEIKQGGLSSPFYFNLFYQQLIEELKNSSKGEYIDNYGLKFNLYKTSCVIFGKHPFSVSPVWKYSTKD